MKRHIAFVNMPAHGHVNPTLPLVEELVRRGHRVSYAVGPAFAAVVEAAGAEVVATPSEMPPIPRNFGAGSNLEAMAPMMEHMLEDLRATFPVLRAHFEQDPPDVVCFDVIALSGRMLAEKLGVPEVALVPHFAGNEKFSMRDLMTKKSSTVFDPKNPVLVKFMGQMQEVATEFGVSFTPRSMGAQTAPSTLNLVFIPKEFQLAGDTFDDRFVFVGPSIGHRGNITWKPADADAPLLFISLGTVFNQRPEFFRTCIEALRDSDWQVAMSIGDVVDPADLGDIPANFDIRPSFPQPVVLQHAAAFLTHAGMNSTMESLYYGVPLIAVPQMPEQEANARRAEELGLGRRLEDSEVTAELLRTTVDEVAGDDRIRANIAAMRESIRTSGGAVAGADALEALLAV